MKKDLSALSFSEKERICESVFIANGPYWHVYTDGTKMQNIFCDIKLGESLFRDARSYFNALTRNAEAFSQIASRLKDAVFLTDDELFSAMISFINKEYSIRTAAELSAQQKIDTARHMHFNYNASNQQLRRLLRIDIAILEELFP